jgi:regulator of sirC expression with transglutaminase-like and TPR domain
VPAPDPTERFAAVVARRDDMALDEACLLIAAHARPGLDVEAERQRLDELAAGVADPTPAGVVGHLCDGLGFTGERDAYHDATTSLLPEVLDRRRGIPIALATVALEVGRRVGVPLVGIGMPGHFLVRGGGPDGTYFDLFHDGVALDAGGCRALFAGLHPAAQWEDAFLRPVGATAIVVRTLANLATAYRRSGDRAALAWTLGLRLLLPGVTARERRELAVLLGALGRFDQAAVVLEATGEERDALAAARLRARLN